MIKNCEYCKKEYDTKLGRRKFCSDNCKKEAWKPFKAAIDKEYGLRNLDKKSEYDRIRYEENPQAAIDRTAKWRKENPDIRQSRDRFNLDNNPQYFLCKNLLTIIKHYFKHDKKPKYSKLIAMLPYSFNELENRLKSTIPEGCTWQDYKDGKLHMDHIVAECKFKYTSEKDEDFKICWGLDNLRLLTAKENITKQAN